MMPLDSRLVQAASRTDPSRFLLCEFESIKAQSRYRVRRSQRRKFFSAFDFTYPSPPQAKCFAVIDQRVDSKGSLVVDSRSKQYCPFIALPILRLRYLVGAQALETGPESIDEDIARSRILDSADSPRSITGTGTQCDGLELSPKPAPAIARSSHSSHMLVLIARLSS
jgi:hypothetical protein